MRPPSWYEVAMAKTTKAERIRRLGTIPLFAGLSKSSLERIATTVTEVEFPHGHVLIQPNQQASGLYVIEEGEVTVELRGRTLERGPGECIGELALLNPDAVRVARVRAKTAVLCLAISREQFQKMLEEEPKIAIALLGVLAQRLTDNLGLEEPTRRA